MVAARYGIGAFSQTAGAISQGFLGDLGQQLASNAYSRKQENEADDKAFQFCITNGVDPFAMYHALNVLIQLSGDSGQQSRIEELMSTHPNTKKRATRIKQMAEAAGYKMTTTGTIVGKGNTAIKPSGNGTQPKKTTVTPKGSTSTTNTGGKPKTITPKKN